MIYRDRRTLTLRFLNEVICGDGSKELSNDAYYSATVLKGYLSSDPIAQSELIQMHLAVLKKHFKTLALKPQDSAVASDRFDEAVKLWNYWGKQEDVRKEVEAMLNRLYSVVEELETRSSSLNLDELKLLSAFAYTYYLTLDLFNSNRLSQINSLNVYKAIIEAQKLVTRLGYYPYSPKPSQIEFYASKREESIDALL